ncbi:Glycosyltransferase involved in cell wall bisynthesis [Abditibacterium utsteinense]|uniref:Glycosyltransferase involved in cell wall bisynthesis n=1 Tax=Abditibacterium utsteinense TaxID=1960156 RepID=A0A2S8SQJ1_9BACT|nr:glycosyltransferase [Abditibacterium utsteinense]PQV63067.1 Glycosyltransferase involved in cell wall bisynthesis [Abditibacterium utsteinense]
MTIAYLFERFPSPTETFLAREVAALRQRNVSIEVYALDAGDGAQKIETPSPALKLGGKAKFFRVAGEKLGLQLQKRGVSHVHATWANHIADIAQHAAQSAGITWSFAAHARDLWVDGSDFSQKMKSAQFAFACTRAGESELQKHGENVLYVPHGLPLDNFPFETWEKERETRIIGVGRLVEKKGWMDLIAALGICQRLDNRGHTFRAQIIGDGPLRPLLQKQIGALGLQDSVVLRGALKAEEVVAAMQEANCFVLPSRRAADGDRDGLANVLLEAGALGLPLVTSDNDGARDFADESTAFLFPSADASALAGAINRVRTSPALTAERCCAARKRIEQHFDIAKNAGIVERAFASLI